ncbi:M20/M25/M40 family metallo-hydrolase [Micromonospora sp. NPDC047134]|uniref:M20/M25/M40 family metallo-hydrolase n=1 Tax=Micromonospora sp. NPDC047134 TaxID=3154340 RepID=UPI0033BFE47A
MSALGFAANSRQDPLYVIKLGSATLAHERVFDELADLRARGARLLVVVGGAEGIRQHYAEIGRPIRTLTLANGDEVRYCPPEELPYIVQAYRSVTLRRIAEAAAARGLTAFTAVAADGALVTGRPNPPVKVTAEGRTRVVRDHRAGRVAEVATDRLQTLLDAFDMVCVCAPVADPGHAPLNVDADVLAAELANALAADHLRLVTGTPGLLRDPTDPTDRITDAVAGETGRYAKGRMRQKVRAAEIALAGPADVAITGPHTLSPATGTRFWRAPAPAPDLELLARATEISSVSGDERELAEYLVDWCTTRGLYARIDDLGNLVVTRGEGGRHRLLMLAHLDTVPYRWPARWEGETLYGRGSVDAKGCLTAFLEVLAETAVPPDCEIRVVGAVEEEITAKGAFHVRDHYPADAVIVGEPSGAAALTVGYYGLLKARLTVSHPVGHTAGRGVSTAADRLHEHLAAIRDRLAEVAPEAMLAVLGVRAGNAGDRQQGEALLDIRVPPTASVQDLVALIRETAPDAQPQILRATPGVLTPRSTPLVKAFSRAFREQDLVPRFLAKKGSSDMNTLATTWQGIPMVAYGPGDATLDHTPHEHLPAAQLRTARQVLKIAVRNWLTARTPQAVR